MKRCFNDLLNLKNDRRVDASCLRKVGLRSERGIEDGDISEEDVLKTLKNEKEFVKGDEPLEFNERLVASCNSYLKP